MALALSKLRSTSSGKCCRSDAAANVLDVWQRWIAFMCAIGYETTVARSGSRHHYPLVCLSTDVTRELYVLGFECLLSDAVACTWVFVGGDCGALIFSFGSMKLLELLLSLYYSTL